MNYLLEKHAMQENTSDLQVFLLSLLVLNPTRKASILVAHFEIALLKTFSMSIPSCTLKP